MKKIAITAILIAVFCTTNAHALCDGDQQAGCADISFTIPIVALIDVSNPGTTFTFIAPTNAGEGFTNDIDPYNNVSSLAISSNLPNSKLLARTDIDLPAGMSLSVATNSIPGQSGRSRQLHTPSTTDKEITPIGLVSTTGAQITLSAASSNSGGMIPHGTTNLKVIYTLTEN